MRFIPIRSLLASSAILALASTFAFADVVFNRGNSADPESLDPHKTSTVYEAHILRDLFQGLMMRDAKAEIGPGAGRLPEPEDCTTTDLEAVHPLSSVTVTT